MCSLDSSSPNFHMLFCQCATTFLWGVETGGRKYGPCTIMSLPLKRASVVRKNGLYFPSSTENRQPKKWISGWAQALENPYVVCKLSLRSQVQSCCLAVSIDDRWSRKLNRDFLAQCQDKMISKEFWVLLGLQQKVLGWYLHRNGKDWNLL